jgi:hypothetical protein
MAKRGRLGGLARRRRHGNIPGTVTPRVLGGRVTASHGIVELRAHGFGGRFESELQRAWRLGTKATRSRLVGHRRRLAHRKCTVDPCRRCQRIIDAARAAL